MKKHLSTLVAAFLLALAGSVHAQDAPPYQDPQSAPDAQVQPVPDQQGQGDSESAPEAQPGVARVSLMQGDVSTQHGDNGQWTAVTVNTPISQDDRVSTGEKSRAELQLDGANILRLSDRSTARIANLSRTQIQVQVGQGLVTYNVSKGSEARTEIDTPNASIRPLEGDGEYRILVNSDAETQIIVRRGSAEISTSQGTTRVEKGQMITVAGTDSPQYKVARAPGPDEWDGWNDSRNRTIRSADSWHKTNPYYVGTEDLDGHGVWTEVPDYGQVWVPAQDPGWAPYRTGRWVYQPYYGWTWVSYEPWGWAPYHYGRWFVYGGSWAWWPGPVAVYPAYYPIWAPAYVSFFGWGGGGWGFGFGFGGGFGRVGWLPIGPCDGFHPWWGRGGGRVNVVNINNIHNTTINRGGWVPLRGNTGRQFSNLNEAERNQRVRSGISSMDGKRFGREAVPGHQQGVSAASFKQASMMTGKLPVTPSRESFSSTNRAPGASSVRSAQSSSRHFFSPATAKNSVASTTANRDRMSGGNSTLRGNTAVGARSSSGANQTAGTGNAPSRTVPLPGPARMSGGNSTSRNNSAQRQFTPPSAQRGASQQQRVPNNQASPRGQGNPAGQNNQGGRNGWQHFSPPPSRNTQSAGPSQSPRQFQPPANSSRGGNSHAVNRPPLNMNKPIVQPRGGYPNGSRGGYPGASRGPYPNGPAGGYRGAPPSPAQRSVPRPSAPPSSSAPRGNSGSAPRGNSGGGSRGGGGGNSHGGGGGSSHSGGSRPH
jgi:uncharacterized membrane protein YgcG